MGRERKEETEFSQDIDRILSGGQAKAGLETGEEYAGEIDFARKVRELCAAPSPAFQERLKQRLLLKLAEDEERVAEKERAGSFLANLKDVVWQSPAWRTATVTIALAVLALVVVWRAGVFAPERGGMVTAPATAPRPSVESVAPPSAPASLDVYARIDKDVYLPGERVVIDFSFKNLTGEHLLIEAFPPEVSITGPVPDEATIISYPANGPTRIMPGEVAVYGLTWDQRRADGSQVPVGDYQIKVGEIRLEEGKGTASVSSLPVIKIVSEIR